MSEQLGREPNSDKEAATSGLLLVVEPLSGGAPLRLSTLGLDDDNVPPDVDTDDTVGDTDYNDDTDTDTNDDADGTD